MQQPISKVSLSVRELVEFILASGSIDNRGGSADLYQRANEGSRLHRKLQRQAHERHGKAYRSEVVFSDERELDGILFSVYGRADGVLREDSEIPCLREGEGFLMYSGDFYVSPLDIRIEFLKAASARRWLEALVLRHVERVRRVEDDLWVLAGIEEVRHGS